MHFRRYNLVIVRAFAFADFLVGFFVGKEDGILFSDSDNQLAVLVETIEVFAVVHDIKHLPKWFNRSHVKFLSCGYGGVVRKNPPEEHPLEAGLSCW